MVSKPKRLVVEYEDSSRKEVDFDRVDRQTQSELVRLGIGPPPGVKSSKHYLLLQWKDGWQEVIGLDKDSVDLLRFYVIRRIEDRGRLSVDVGADYPELFIMKREPMELSSLLIIGNGGTKKYSLDSAVERWEGTFEAGGKKEYVKYDKTDPQSPHESGEATDKFNEMMDSVKKELDKIGLSAKSLLAADETRRTEEYQRVAKALGIRGYDRQGDVYGFIDFVVRRLAKKGN